MTHDQPDRAFEIVASSVEEFLRLLRGRKGAADQSRRPRSVAPMAVFVSRIQNVTSGRYAFPKVTRHVVAAFAYGPDVVFYRRTTSNAVELPEVARKLAERQREACEQIRSEIELGIGEAKLCVPVRECGLHHWTGTDQEGKA